MNDSPLPPDPVPSDAPAAPGPTGIRTQNRLAIVGTVALVVALVVGGAVLLSRGTGTPSPSPVFGLGESPTTGSAPTAEPSAPPSAGSSAAPSATAGPAPTPEPIPSDAPRLGRDDAKVVVEYWADFQCPACAKFVADTIPQLQAQIDDGTVALVHRDYAFLGPESIDAAVAVRCAAREGRYWEMHDAVYAAQAGENQGAFTPDKLIAIGESIGLDRDKLTVCLDDRDALVSVLDDTAAALRQAVNSTPTVVVNGTRFTGVPDMTELQAAIDGALAGTPPAPAPTPPSIRDPWAELAPDGRTVGDAAAPVTVELWLDYQGLSGPVLAHEIAPELRSRVAAGDIRVVLHDMPSLGDESLAASAAVRCVGAQNGPAFLVSDVLSAAGSGPDNLIFTTKNLLMVASRLGLDVRAFDSCLQDPATLAMIAEDTQSGRASGIEHGPAVVIVTGGLEAARFEGTLVAANVLAAIDEAIP